jgi:hypothetical protein
VNVIGLDPGPEKSAYVVFNGLTISSHDIVENNVMLTRLEVAKETSHAGAYVLVCEQISMGGQVAGPSVFETCFWTGRFCEMWSPRRWDRVKRIKVKDHLAHTVRANDAVIRQVLIERFGPGTEVAIGKKSKPGPLYGIASHEWAALAVAVTWYDLNGHKPDELRPGVTPEF